MLKFVGAMILIWIGGFLAYASIEGPFREASVEFKTASMVAALAGVAFAFWLFKRGKSFKH